VRNVELNAIDTNFSFSGLSDQVIRSLKAEIDYVYQLPDVQHQPRERARRVHTMTIFNDVHLNEVSHESFHETPRRIG